MAPYSCIGYADSRIRDIEERHSDTKEISFKICKFWIQYSEEQDHLILIFVSF